MRSASAPTPTNCSTICGRPTRPLTAYRRACRTISGTSGRCSPGSTSCPTRSCWRSCPSAKTPTECRCVPPQVSGGPGLPTDVGSSPTPTKSHRHHQAPVILYQVLPLLHHVARMVYQVGRILYRVPLVSSAARAVSSATPLLCTIAQCGGTGSPPLSTTAQDGATDSSATPLNQVPLLLTKCHPYSVKCPSYHILMPGQSWAAGCMPPLFGGTPPPEVGRLGVSSAVSFLCPALVARGHLLGGSAGEAEGGWQGRGSAVLWVTVECSPPSDRRRRPSNRRRLPSNRRRLPSHHRGGLDGAFLLPGRGGQDPAEALCTARGLTSSLLGMPPAIPLTLLKAHLKKIFEFMDKLIFDESEMEIAGFSSAEGEVITFTQSIEPTGNVEQWLGVIQSSMKSTVRQLLAEAVQSYRVCPGPGTDVCWFRQEFCFTTQRSPRGGGGGAERSDPTQHAKGRTGDCPGPRKETTTRRNVTRGG